MKVLSLFDGMACGMLAMQRAGVEVDQYIAFEIDKYAIQTATHNFPIIEQRGDVFAADFSEFYGFDFLVGGSPCTYWSIAQKNNRETEASGMGWELFSQYVRALHEAKPKYFVYENNKSMSNAIRESITDAFGFEPICINSALVSAQNRQRLYWVGKRNQTAHTATYSKVEIQQPEDRGILLRDVLDGVTDKEKGRCGNASVGRTTTCEYFHKSQNTMTYEPVEVRPVRGLDDDTKCRTLTASYWKTSARDAFVDCAGGRTMAAEPVNMTSEGKARTIRATCYKDGIRNMVGNDVDRKTCVAEPVRVGTYPNNAKNQAHDSQQYRVYSVDGKSVTQCGNGGGLGAKTGLYAISVGNMYEKQGQNGQLFSVDGKSKTLSAGTGVSGRGIGSNNAPKVCAPCDGVYAIPVEFDGERPVKAVSGADGKRYDVYEVKDGFITIKGKRYAIKLADGYYIIRKLTVSECKRLQTVPEWYEFPVSDTQAYKMLGNGWTVDVIAHILKGCLHE